MARIKNIQSGTVNLGGARNATVSITAVDLSKSLLRFSFSASSGRPSKDSLIRGKFNSTTQIEFEHSNIFNFTASSCQVQWYVVEYDSGVSVQSGEFNSGASTPSPVDITITAVSTANAVPIISNTGGINFGIGGSEALKTKFNSSTALRVEWDRAVNHFTNSLSVCWFVVESADITHTRYDHVATGTSSNDTIVSVNPAKTALITSMSSTRLGDTNWNAGFQWSCRLASPTQINYSRYVNDGSNTDSFQTHVVEFSDNTVVSRYATTLTSAQTSKPVTILISDVANAFVNTTGVVSSSSLFTTQSTTETDASMHDIKIDSTVQATVTRQLTASVAADVEFEIIEPGAGVSPNLMSFFSMMQ